MQTARKPYTCKQCHVGPDVPVYKVYSASKHGNVFDSKQHEWDFSAVPWEIGGDFTAPTCAVCHVSLLVDPDGGTPVDSGCVLSKCGWSPFEGETFRSAIAATFVNGQPVWMDGFVDTGDQLLTSLRAQVGMPESQRPLFSEKR